MLHPLTRDQFASPSPTAISVVIRFLEDAYIAGFAALQLYTSILHPALFASSSAPHRAGGGGTFDAVAALMRKACITAAGTVSGRDTSEPALCVASAQDADTLAEVSPAGGAMEFLPLMMTSVYCALGITWAFLRLSFLYLIR